MSRKILFLITTESNKEFAEKIAKLLIKRELAACVSLREIQSFYRWQDQYENTKEIEILIKSKPSKIKPLIKTLKQEISYELPQLIYTIFDSEENYWQWIQKSIT